MAPNLSPPLDPQDIKRTIGKISGEDTGRHIVFISGMHGNEPAGVFALQRVIDRIKNDGLSVRGTIWALQGNLHALKVGKRYLDIDLNRIWITKYNDAPPPPSDTVEVKEREELSMEFQEIMEEVDKEVFFFDLHTTSSFSIPFSSISDTLKNREILEDIPVPTVLGLEEEMEGTLFSYFSELGLSMILFESGQHNLVSSVDNHEAFVWLVLNRLEFIDGSELEDFHQFHNILAKEGIFQKHVFEIKHRHALNGQHSFKMMDGFVNFQPIGHGQILATDENGDVKAPMDGKIFMPLYQEQGSDGFFVIRPIRMFWIRMSGFVRRLGLDKLLSILPGIRRQKEMPNSFRINRKLARFFVLDFFHLLGYRKVIRHDNHFIVKRRPFDWEQPPMTTVRQRFKDITPGF